MTDNTQPEAGSTHIIRLALELGLLWIDGSGRDKVREALDALDTLEAQLEAIGAGGVSGPLMGRAALSANAGEPVAWQYRSLPDVGGVWFECSKERAEQRAAHPDRWEVRPLYAAPPTAQAEGWRLVPVEPTQKMLFVAMNAFVAASASLGAFNAPDAAYRALLAAAPTHPTSSVVVEHG